MVAAGVAATNTHTARGRRKEQCHDLGSTDSGVGFLRCLDKPTTLSGTVAGEDTQQPGLSGRRGEEGEEAGQVGESDIERTARLVATCTAAATAAVLKASSLQVSLHVTCMLHITYHIGTV